MKVAARDGEIAEQVRLIGELRGDQIESGSCNHAGMSRWPCNTRQTSM